MEGFPCVTQTVLQNNIAQQILKQQHVQPRVQLSMQQQVYQNQTLPVMRNTVAPTISTPNQGHNTGINYSSSIRHSGPQFNMNDATFLIPNQTVNMNSFLFCSNMGIMTNANPTGVQVVPHNYQASQPAKSHYLNVNSNVVDGPSRSSNAPEQNSQRVKEADAHVEDIAKSSELTQVKINTEIIEKVGNLKISGFGNIMVSVSDKNKILDMMNITQSSSKSAVFDLNLMRHLYDITNVDIILSNNISCETGMARALRQIVNNKIFTDWLLLKCEKKQIPVFKVINQLEIYSINNFSTLLNLVSQESCLPLPFITKDAKDNSKYFYVNFPNVSNSGRSNKPDQKVKKLNVAVFHDADNGRKRLQCKYFGIKMDCNFGPSFQTITFHVQQSGMRAFEIHQCRIRQILIYRHIVWGFLQAWIRRVGEQHNGCFKAQDIASSLSLCRVDSEQRKVAANDNEMIYFIDYLNLYLTFKPASLKQAKATFSIDNFETHFVCDVPVVQYYRQFFLVNDLHYSDALKNIILFSKKIEESRRRRMNELASMPQDEETAARSNVLLPGDISRSPGQTQAGITETMEHQDLVIFVVDSDRNSTAECANMQTNSSETSQSMNTGMQTNSECVAQQNLPENGEQVAPQVISAPNPPSVPPTKPLLKTRTVQEINSSVELKKMLDSGDINFDSCFKVANIDVLKKKAKESRNTLPNFVREALNHCYVKNMVEVSTEDETDDLRTICRIFNTALDEAMSMETLDSFIEALYRSLQMYFTNATCQRLLNKHVLKAIERRFPALTARLGAHTNQTVNESEVSAARQANQNLASRPAAVVDATRQGTMPRPFPSEQDLQKLYPHLYQNWERQNVQVKCVASVNPVLGASSSTNGSGNRSKECTNVRPKNPVQRVAPQCIRQTSSDDAAGQNAGSVRKQSDPVWSNQQKTTPPSPLLQIPPVPRFMAPPSTDREESPVTSGNDPVNPKGSSRLCKPSATSKNQTLVTTPPVVARASPSAKLVPQVAENDEQASALPKIQNDQSIRIRQYQTVRKKAVGTVPPTLKSPPSKPVQQQHVKSKAVEAASLTADTLDAPTPPPQDIECGMQHTGYSFGRLPHTPLREAVDQREAFRSSFDRPEPIPAFRISRKKILGGGDESNKGEGGLLQIAKEDLKRKFNLKPCSVILNRQDVVNYMRRFKKRRKEGPDSGNDSADDNFISKVRCRKRRKTWNVQFTEAETRAPQQIQEEWESPGSHLSSPLVRTSSASSAGSGRVHGPAENVAGKTQSERQGETTAVKGRAKEDAEAASCPLSGSSLAARQSHEAGTPRDRTTKEGCSMDALREECLRREVRVVLVRLKETPTLKNYKIKLKEEKTEESNSDDACDVGNGSMGLNLPNEKRKYFEMREGNLYLKEQYQVKNGLIVPKEEVTGGTVKSVAGERNQNEPNFFPVHIKTETVVE